VDLHRSVAEPLKRATRPIISGSVTWSNRCPAVCLASCA